MLLIIETHPIQYHAPVWRYLQQYLDIPVTVVYGSDFSIVGYRDNEFKTNFAWDTDLLTGYNSIFLSRLNFGGAKNDNEVNTKGLAKVLFEVKPNAIMLVGYSHIFHHSSLAIAKKTRKPLLFRAETNDNANTRSLLKWFIRNFLLKRFYKNFEFLLPIGKLSSDHYKRLGFFEKSGHMSPYCVDPKPFKTEDNFKKQLCRIVRSQVGLSQNDFVIIFCGKISKRKDPCLILEAINLLDINLKKQISVLLVGDGELRVPLMEKALDFGIVVKHVGFKNQHELSSFYHASDILVLPSKIGETWGLVVNEALHHGLPVIVSDRVGCAEDLVVPGQTGEIFQFGNAKSLRNALLRVIALVGKSDVRQKCREKVAEYSVEKAAKGIAAAYFHIVKK